MSHPEPFARDLAWPGAAPANGNFMRAFDSPVRSVASGDKNACCWGLGMRILRIAGAVCLVVFWTVQPAAAEPSRSDLSFEYHARETLRGNDNDIMRLRYGLEWGDSDGLARVSVFAGIRDVGLNLFASSRDLSLDNPDLGVEAVWLRQAGFGRYGFGGRIGYAGNAATALEVASVMERHGDAVDLRLMSGVQGVSDTLPGREDVSAFGVAEATWWVRDSIALRGGVQVDHDGVLATFGAEAAIPGTSMRLFLDWGHAVDDYRGVGGYNDLSGGIRFDFGGGSLREGARRSLFRPAEVQ